MGTIRKYNRKVVAVPVSAPEAAKKAQPIMFATRSGTIVCVSKVATKKIAPTRANMLARVMLASTSSSRRLNNASDVMLLGSRPSWIRIFATLRLFAAVSRMRSSVVDRSALLTFIGFPGFVARFQTKDSAKAGLQKQASGRLENGTQGSIAAPNVEEEVVPQRRHG